MRRINFAVSRHSEPTSPPPLKAISCATDSRGTTGKRNTCACKPPGESSTVSEPLLDPADPLEALELRDFETVNESAVTLLMSSVAGQTSPMNTDSYMQGML
jgi:hypothetical protein